MNDPGKQISTKCKSESFYKNPTNTPLKMKVAIQLQQMTKVSGTHTLGLLSNTRTNHCMLSDVPHQATSTYHWREKIVTSEKIATAKKNRHSFFSWGVPTTSKKTTAFFSSLWVWQFTSHTTATSNWPERESSNDFFWVAQQNCFNQLKAEQQPRTNYREKKSREYYDNTTIIKKLYQRQIWVNISRKSL